MVNQLTEKERQDIRDSIKGNLETDFIENYKVWKNSLIEVNKVIEEEVKKTLLISPMYKDLLYTYDELCKESLIVVDSLPLVADKLDPKLISKKITREVTFARLGNILETYINAYEKY
ncbi:MAG: hypothetical protein SLAVMIC_00620 [uncultured marine phage]|uniref:Uncharacterized protein n=1 Tax=uncultured marine phage TaxID=707152 RepID=A0A8D9CAC3_9VIRU|nr:MAG: hypothetical protein SLAVMIC_00620 [uncultured marine phage]